MKLYILFLVLFFCSNLEIKASGTFIGFGNSDTSDIADGDDESYDDEEEEGTSTPEDSNKESE